MFRPHNCQSATRDKQIAYSLIEDQFWWDPRIRAGKNRCKWRLPFYHGHAAGSILVWMAPKKRRPSFISLYQCLERLRFSLGRRILCAVPRAYGRALLA